MAFITDKRRRSAGFSLAEMLLTVLLMAIVLGGLTSAVAAAVNVFNKVRVKSESEILLSTVGDAVYADLSTASSIETDDNGKITQFYSGNRGYEMSYDKNTSADNRFIKVNVLNSVSEETKQKEETKLDLVPEGSQPFGIYPVLSDIKLETDGTINYSVTIHKKSGDVVTEADYIVRPITYVE